MKEIVTLLRKKNKLERYDVFPFIILYAISTYLTMEVLEDIIMIKFMF